jgi:hypothetical protein
MPRPIQAFVHTDALRHNLQHVRTFAPDARIWAVVKANAYGHGIERVFEGLRGCDGFALLDLDEAQRVRALGWRGPVWLLEGVFDPRDLELCSRLDLWHTVHCEAQIDMLSRHKTIEERLVDYWGRAPEFARQFANAPVGSLAFACTGTSYLVGKEAEDRVLAQVTQESGGLPAMSAATAVVYALNALGAKRIGLVSPYLYEIQQKIVANFASHGLAYESLDRHVTHALVALGEMC